MAVLKEKQFHPVNIDANRGIDEIYEDASNELKKLK